MLSVAFYCCAEYRYAGCCDSECNSTFSVSWAIIRLLDWHNLQDNGNKFTPEIFYENENVILTLFQFLQFAINN
jgi:hypothetical protein